MTETTERSFLATLWFGFWGVIDGFRKIVLNLAFLMIFFLVLVFFISGDKPSPIENKTTLLLQPVGVVVEQYTGTVLGRALSEATGNQEYETRLRDLVVALKLAKTDSNITQVLIDVRQLWGIGLASLEELELALDDFKASGKPVYAIGSFMDQKQYHLASNADELFIEDDGVLWLEGLASYRNYYSEGLDKLAVDINLFRVGTYKSAMEPYIRSDMSADAKRANRFLLNGLWQDYLDSIARHRGLPVAILDESIEQYPNLLENNHGDAAATALQAGLVDAVLTRPELRTRLTQSDTGSSNSEGDLRHIHHSSYLERKFDENKGGKIAVLVAEGEIVGGSTEPGMIGAASLSNQLRRISRDDSIKAVVLRINSPGGDATASEVIRQEVLALQQTGKPVIVSMGDVAASGGYWIAMGADEIWASESTITGSIGIFGMLPTFQNALAKLGVYTDGVGTSDRAGGLRVDRPLHPETASILQNMTENGYRRFVDLVSEYRQMSIDEVDAIAQGRVWTGQQALGHNLVDQLGGIDAAVAAAARYADLGDNYYTEYVTEELGAWETLVVGMTAKAVASLDLESTALNKLSQANHPVLSSLPQSLQRSIGHALAPLSRNYERPSILVHCLCTSP